MKFSSKRIAETKNNRQGSYGEDINAKKWICPNDDTVNTDDVCVICGYPRPGKVKSKWLPIVLMMPILFITGILIFKLMTDNNKDAEDIYYLSNGSYIVTEYTADGQIKKRTSYTADGELFDVSEYGSNGEIINSNSYGEDGQLVYSAEFDSDGELAGSTFFYDDGHKTEYEYERKNVDNDKREEVKYVNGKVSNKTIIGPHGWEEIYSYDNENGEVEFKLQRGFDSNGKECSLVCYDKENVLLAEWEYVDGERGDVVFYDEDNILHIKILACLL